MTWHYFYCERLFILINFRSKLLKLQTRTPEPKTLYKDTKGTHSLAKHMYARAHKKSREPTSLLKEHHQDRTRTPETSTISQSSSTDSSATSLPPLTANTGLIPRLADLVSKAEIEMAEYSAKMADLPAKFVDYSSKLADYSSKMTDFRSIEGDSGENRLVSPSIAEQFAYFKEEEYAKPLAVPSGNRIHLTRLVLSETSERPKSSPDSIELEENAQVNKNSILFLPILHHFHLPSFLFFSHHLIFVSCCILSLFHYRHLLSQTRSPPAFFFPPIFFLALFCIPTI